MFGNFLFRTFVGAIAVSIVSLGRAPLLILGLIICSGGKGLPVALLIALPVCYFAGLLCTIWFVPIGNHLDARVLPDPTGDLATRAALEDYVLTGLRLGKGWVSMHSDCLRAGWSEDDIKAAFDAAQVRRASDY